MSQTWILVANSSRAQIFTTNKLKLFHMNGHDEEHLNLLEAFQQDTCRQKNSDLVSDKRGRHSSSKKSQGSYENTTAPKTYQAELFAKLLAQKLDSGRKQHDFDDLIIVAPAHFTGMLYKHFCHSLEDQLSQTIHKDYTLLPDKRLVKQIQTYL